MEKFMHLCNEAKNNNMMFLANCAWAATNVIGKRTNYTGAKRSVETQDENGTCVPELYYDICIIATHAATACIPTPLLSNATAMCFYKGAEIVERQQHGREAHDLPPEMQEVMWEKFIADAIACGLRAIEILKNLDIDEIKIGITEEETKQMEVRIAKLMKQLR